MDAMDASRLCLRNDSAQRRSPRPSHSRTGRHDSGQHTRNALRIAAARGSDSTYATHIYDTARGSHHDHRPPLARLALVFVRERTPPPNEEAPPPEHLQIWQEDCLGWFPEQAELLRARAANATAAA